MTRSTDIFISLVSKIKPVEGNAFLIKKQFHKNARFCLSTIHQFISLSGFRNKYDFF